MSTTGKDITIQYFTSTEIIKRNITRQEVAIAYYYCDFSEPKSLEARNIFGTIIRELLEQIVIPGDLEQQIDQVYRPGTRTPADGELASILCATLKYFSKVYIFIDGLDECGKDEQVTVLSLVNQLTRSCNAEVRILITSREEVIISTLLRGFPRLQISAGKNSPDIAAFVAETVKSNIRSGALTIEDPSLELGITSALIDGAHGMFLWVHFQLADLCEAVSDFDLRETLRNLPKGMIETYARVLQKIAKSDTNMALAQRIFKWVVCAKRPLLITELGEAVVFGPADRSWDAGKIPNATRLVQACRSLVVFDEDDKTVRLAHHTVRQFLLEPGSRHPIPGFHFQLSQADVEAGEICVAYLSFSDFETQITVSGPDNLLPAGNIPGPIIVLESVATTLGLNHIISAICKFGQYICAGGSRQQPPTFNLVKFTRLRKSPPQSLREKYLFLDYAIENWVSHTSNFSEDNTTMWGSFGHLAMDKPMAFDIRVWGYSSVSTELPYTSLFRWAVDAGHVPLLKLLSQLPRGSNLHAYCRQESEKGRSIVLNASGRGHTKVVEFLAGLGCIDGRDGKPLVEAAKNGHDGVVRLLLEFGLCQGAKNEALQRAAGNGHAAVVSMLLKNEPPLHVQSGWSKVALVEAAERGYDGVLVVLLRKAASFEAAVVNLEKEWGISALHAAARRGFDGVARLLLEEGADVTTKDSDGWTALHRAAWSGHDAVVRQLLEKGADMTAKDGDGWTVLHRAAWSGHEAVVRLLLGKGADGTFAEADPGSTTLHRAAWSGREAVVQLLLEKGADLTAKDSDGSTALHWAAWRGHEAVVRLLLEKGADAAAKDSDGSTALHWAARRGHEAVARLLTPLTPNS